MPTVNGSGAPLGHNGNGNGNGNGINYSVGYEFIDDGILISDDASNDLDSKQKSAAKRRTSARQLSSNPNAANLNTLNNYRSNEVSYY